MPAELTGLDPKQRPQRRKPSLPASVRATFGTTSLPGRSPTPLVQPSRPRPSSGWSKPALRPRLDCGGGAENRRAPNHPLSDQPEGIKMSERRNKYLDQLKAQFPETCPGSELPKLPKGGFDSFDSSQHRPISEFSPPLDADGEPCGGCPKCNQGEFWRWPKFHSETRPAGCAGSARHHHGGAGPCDFCGVPDSMLPANGENSST